MHFGLPAQVSKKLICGQKKLCWLLQKKKKFVDFCKNSVDLLWRGWHLSPFSGLQVILNIFSKVKLKMVFQNGYENMKSSWYFFKYVHATIHRQWYFFFSCVITWLIFLLMCDNALWHCLHYLDGRSAELAVWMWYNYGDKISSSPIIWIHLCICCDTNRETSYHQHPHFAFDVIQIERQV